MKRNFKKSKYEKEYSKYPTTNLEERFEGYDIYTYKNIGDEIRYKFWTSSESPDYYSGLQSLEETKELIIRIKYENNKS
jgi:hypothetical protein